MSLEEARRAEQELNSHQAKHGTGRKSDSGMHFTILMRADPGTNGVNSSS